MWPPSSYLTGLTSFLMKVLMLPGEPGKQVSLETLQEQWVQQKIQAGGNGPCRDFVCFLPSRSDLEEMTPAVEDKGHSNIPVSVWSACQHPPSESQGPHPRPE